MEQKVDGKSLGIGCLVVIGIIAILTFWVLNSSNDNDTSDSKDNIIRTGDRVYVTVDTHAAYTKDGYDLYNSYALAKNTTGMAEMISNGEVFEIKKGTRVNVVERSIASVKVSDSTRSGWIPKEFVSKNRP